MGDRVQGRGTAGAEALRWEQALSWNRKEAPVSAGGGQCCELNGEGESLKVLCSGTGGDKGSVKSRPR